MKFNWKILIAIVVLLGVIFWGFDSVRTRSYSGTDLNFQVGTGPVTVTNPSAEALPVQLVASQAGTFTVSSTIDDQSGRSTREGNGRNATQTFEFELPSGVSEFTVVRGSGASFVASSDTSLEATVQPLDAENSQATLVAMVIVILAALFYISRATEHRWISRFRGTKAKLQDAQPQVASAASDA
jgi:hypothetical protein